MFVSGTPNAPVLNRLGAPGLRNSRPLTWRTTAHASVGYDADMHLDADRLSEPERQTRTDGQIIVVRRDTQPALICRLTFATQRFDDVRRHRHLTIPQARI